MARHQIEESANPIFVSLVGEANATLPPVDLWNELYTIPWSLEHSVYQPVKKLTADMITSKEVGGSGIFDVMMAGLAAHLKVEFDKQRITGAEYAKAYVALTQSALQMAVQFALGQDAAFWSAAQSQAQAITARVQGEIAKNQAMLERANYALTKAKLASEDSAYGTNEFNYSNLLPQQEKLLKEQVESQHAQTSDKRLDQPTVDVAGLLGQQKQLYAEQVQSYRKDAQLKAAKVFMDSWVTQKTIDESVRPSQYFAGVATDANGNQINDAAALDDIFREIRKQAIADGVNSMP